MTFLVYQPVVCLYKHINYRCVNASSLFQAAEDVDFLRFTAPLEGIPGGLLGIADAQVVYSWQMLANKNMSIKDTSKPQMVVKFLCFFPVQTDNCAFQF